MQLYRICKRKYCQDLSGTGAGLYGVRWNPVGLNTLYTAGSISLAYLEFMVHNIHLLRSQNICLVTLEVPTDAYQTIPVKDLPDDWASIHYIPQACQKLGEAFLQNGKHYLLRVPSVIVESEFNFILNPVHMLHQQTRIVDIKDPLRFDERLVTGLKF